MTEERTRGFEVVSSYQNQDIRLPRRSTHYAAGYDLEAAEDMILPSYWRQVLGHLMQEAKQGFQLDTSKTDDSDLLKSSLVPTGLKAYMREDEYLQIVNRSSNPLKRFLALPNGIGIIDQDYYNNSKNEGHIYVQLINYGLRDYKIKKGDRIAQGIFSPYLLTDDDTGGVSQRQGGFGSSGD